MGPQPSFSNDDVHPPNYDQLGAEYRKRNPNTTFVSKDCGLEDFSGTDFLDMYAKFEGASSDVAPGVADAWQQVAIDLARVSYEFMRRADDVRGWEGEAANAANQNRAKSQNEIIALLGASRFMHSSVGTFQETIEAVRGALVNNRESYRLEVEQNQDVESKNANYQVYAQTTRHLMSQAYAPPVRAVSDSVPSLDISKPAVDQPPPAGTNGSPGGGAGGGSGLPRGGAGSPVSATGLPKSQSFLQQTPTGAGNPAQGLTDALNQATQGASDAAQGVGDAAKGATDAAKSAAKQAIDAATKAASQGVNGAGMPPEGVLGLGPNGLRGATSKAGGSSGGGAGGGVGVPRELSSRLTSEAASSTKATGTPTTTAARAGLAPGAAGGGGGGAPAAGSRGSGGDDKAYKGNKVLRRARNGEEVVGETEAVLPVIGAAEAKPTEKPNGT